MKLKRALIENFKGVRSCEIDFAPAPGAAPRRLTTLVGDNGSGKTTVLQAIALTLSLATRRTRSPNDLRWHGFLAERLSSLGSARVELDVLFDAAELTQIRSLYEEWFSTRSIEWLQENNTVPPSTLTEVKLVFKDGRVTAASGGHAAYLQFLGRYYIKILLGLKPSLRSHFREVGDVFWFDQHRNLGSRVPENRRMNEHAAREEPEPRESWTAGVEQLREDLIAWWGYHRTVGRDPSRDYLDKLEQHFNILFPGTRFAGVEPRDVPWLTKPEFYFWFEREGRRFDLAELSSGEQAVFPLLSEFARLDIARSIVLIDELELHLHPPQQQALLGALRQLGPDCQYILTTHSPYLVDAIPQEEIVRMEGGRRCL